MAGITASVEVLTAEVRTLMVGSRQVTMSVWKQLDTVPLETCEPFGRVRYDKAEPGDVWIVGRSVIDGSLVRAVSVREHEMDSYEWNQPDNAPMELTDWCVVGPHQDLVNRLTSETQPPFDPHEKYTRGPFTCPGETYDSWYDIPKRPDAAVIACRGDYRVTWIIPDDTRVSSKVPPGAWSYASSDAQVQAEKIAAEWLDGVDEYKETRGRYLNLPLIVLAGLR